MAVKLRLTRMGAKKAPFYRIVAVDGRQARDGQYIEQIGHYDPIKNDVKLDVDAAKKWLANGAQPTDTVKNLLFKAGALEQKPVAEKKVATKKAAAKKAE